MTERTPPERAYMTTAERQMLDTIEQLRARIAELEGAVLAEREACAKVMENLCFLTDIDELMGMTKQEMSARTCHEGAKAIRERTDGR